MIRTTSLSFVFFAYRSIIGVIRDQKRVGPIASTSTGSRFQTENRDGCGQEKRKSKMNVVRTMITIVICFCICYLPYKVNCGSSFQLSSYLPHNVYGTSPPFSLDLT